VVELGRPGWDCSWQFWWTYGSNGCFGEKAEVLVRAGQQQLLAMGVSRLPGWVQQGRNRRDEGERVEWK
jgi:hypothetical protein